MTTPSVSPGGETFYPYTGPVDDTSVLSWWNAPPPVLETPTQIESSLPTLPATVNPDTPFCTRCGDHFASFCAAVRAKWDRGSLVVISKTATPCIIIGLLATIIGLGGAITAISGWNIPGLEIIVNNMPISVMLSLILIKTGLHSIDSGVKRSRRKQRNRQELTQFHRLFQIENNTFGATPEAWAKYLKELKRRDNRGAPEHRLSHRLPVQGLPGKESIDVPSGRVDTYNYKLEIQQHFLLSAPKLDSTRLASPGLETKPPSSCWDKWYDWWYRQLPVIGTLDIALGQIMLFTGIAAVVFSTIPIDSVPPGLSIIAKDPSLSVSFSLLMLGNWVNCTQTGWRMLTYRTREEKRTRIEQDLQHIDLLLEKKRSQEFYNWLLGKLYSPKTQEQLTKLHKEYITEMDKHIDEAAKKTVPHKPTGATHWLHKKVGQYVPYMAKPSILLGILITLAGVACLGMSVTNNIPHIFETLVKNTSLSALYLGGVIVAGLHATHRGAAMLERPEKDKWKGKSINYRNEMIDMPQLSKPERVAPSGSTTTTFSDVTVPEFIERKDSAPLEAIKELQIKAPVFWQAILKGLWVPDLILGGFLLVCSIAGITMCSGGSVPVGLEFIKNDPSFSGAFFVSLLGISIDALNTSWRMGSYHRRRKEDLGDLDILKRCYERLLSERAVV